MWRARWVGSSGG